jgi:hypothetical protein
VPIRQITCFKFKSDVPHHERTEIVVQLRRLDTDSGLDVDHRVWLTLKPCDHDFVQETTFPSDEEREKWRSHPAHTAIVERLKETADWTRPALFNPDHF